MARPFRFAIQAKNTTDAKAWAEQARKVEDLGYSTLTLPDHFDGQLAPTLALQAAADATTTLKVGALVWCNDYRHPLVFAQEMSTLDLLSDGRLELGIGAGWMETDYVVEADPYGLELDLMDSLKPGDVVIHSTDFGGTNAPWGELMSTVAAQNGAVGTVCDSQVRDCVRIVDMGFPVYYGGIRPLDSKGRARVMDYDVPVMCGEVLVHPGELVFADFDGVVVIPKSVETEVLRLAHEKVGQETASRQALLAGKSLKEVYATYGVL